MEIVDACSGKRWRLRVLARGEDTVRWLRAFEPAELPAPTAEERACGDAEAGDVWRFEERHVLASPRDPLLELDARLEPGAASVRARLGGSELELECPSSALTRQAAFVRPASPRETLEVGMRWLVGVGHLGCTHPDEMCFWAPRVRATAYVVDDVAAWLRASTPLPTRPSDKRWRGLFMGLVLGRDASLRAWREIDESVFAQHALHAGYSGVFSDACLPASRGRLLLALASLA